MTTTRVQIQLPNEHFEKLQSIKNRTGAASYTEVMKRALNIYEYLYKENLVIYLRKEDGTEQKVKILGV